MHLTPEQIEADKKLVAEVHQHDTTCDFEFVVKEWPHDCDQITIDAEFDEEAGGRIKRRVADINTAGDEHEKHREETLLIAKLLARGGTALPGYIAALAEKDARIAKLEARLALATKALETIDPDRIHLLRAFLDLEQSRGRWGGSSGETEVQDDLRRFEELQRAALKEIGGE